MSFRSLRLPALMAGAAAAVVSFATPSYAWRHHARHEYRTPHSVAVDRVLYRPAPSEKWTPAPAAFITTVFAAVNLGGAGDQPSNIVGPSNCAYGHPIAPNGEPYCPPYGYYAGYEYPGPR
jgi:hypothetical protein